MEGLLVGERPSIYSTFDTVEPSRDRIACSISSPYTTSSVRGRCR
jgi:hypothetical protein